MADPDRKLDSGVKTQPKADQAQLRIADGAVPQDAWSRLSGELHSAHNLIVRAEAMVTAAGVTIAVDAAELYAKTASPEKVHQLYRTAEDPLKSIRASDVKQGGVNDCFFMASLAGIADTAPSIIKNSIQSNSDGSYTVTFAGAKDSPVKVPAPTDYELQNFAKASPDGIWTSVMEKAFGIYLQDHPDEKDKLLGRANKGTMQEISNWFNNHVIDAFSSHPQELADMGDATAVLKLLTGYQPGGLPLKESHNVDAAKSALEGAFKESGRMPTVAAIGDGNKKAQELGLHSSHAYTILGYENGMVTVRDPNGITVPNEQGKNMPSKDGVFQMKVEDFAQAYDEMYIGRLTPLFGGGGGIIGISRFRMTPKDDQALKTPKP